MSECFEHGLFGLPFNLWRIVKQIVPGTILFLFEYEARQMWGIFEATSYECFNIQPSVYSRGLFPAQVRFKDLKCCRPLSESEFRCAIQDNYFTPTKFHHQLSYHQVYKLFKEYG